MSNQSQTPSRATTPSDCARRDAFLNMTDREPQSLTSFHAFGYGDHLDPFSLPAVPGGARADGGSNQMYNTSAEFHQPIQFPGERSQQSVYHSPASSPSSPNPHYGDFTAFPLSPPHSGGTILSFINEHPPSHQPSLSSNGPQAPSPIHLSSPLHQTAFDVSPSPNLQPSYAHQQRRDSYSSRPDRRHSSASTASIRNFPFSQYSQLASSATSTQPSSVYGPLTIAEDSSAPGSLYVNNGHTHGSGSDGIEPSTNMIQRGPSTNMNSMCHNQSMGPPLSLPPKTGTRHYRKKTPPEACAVCGSNQTPEWRKGPSGLRTLCNACGLTAAKLSTTEPATVEEVWKQLREVGLNRFRGNYDLSDEQKSIAAQSWAAQSANNTNRNTHASRPTPPSAGTNSSQKTTKTSSGSAGRSHPKMTGPNRNASDLTGAHQLFSISRGRGNGLGASFSMHNPGPPPSPLGLGNPYASPTSPHPGSLELNERFKHMSCTAADFNGLSAASALGSGCTQDGISSAHYPSSPLLSSGVNHSPHIMGIYPSTGISHSGRRNSIGGHRMSISSIINQDPPTRPTSTVNPDPHLHQLQQQQAQHMHSLFLQHPAHTGYHKQI